MLRKVIIPAIFIIGMSIFCYPMISNWFNTKKHYTIINDHNNLLDMMTSEEKKDERLKAEKYNETLIETASPIEDPFTQNNDETIATGYFNILDIGETMGSLEIPSIDIYLPIYHGISDEVLQRGIGHMSNSSFPVGGLGTHAALTGHRGLPSSKLFRHLDKMKYNDLFFIHTLDETLAYKIDNIQIVLPNETNWLEVKADKDYVTLITCEPYMINTHRLLVRGARVPFEEDEITKQVVKKHHLKNKTIILIGIGMLLIIAILLIYIKMRNWRKKNEQ